VRRQQASKQSRRAEIEDELGSLSRKGQRATLRNAAANVRQQMLNLQLIAATPDMLVNCQGSSLPSTQRPWPRFPSAALVLGGP